MINKHISMDATGGGLTIHDGYWLVDVVVIKCVGISIPQQTKE
jgi:hypothetical protein